MPKPLVKGVFSNTAQKVTTPGGGATGYEKTPQPAEGPRQSTNRAPAGSGMRSPPTEDRYGGKPVGPKTPHPQAPAAAAAVRGGAEPGVKNVSRTIANAPAAVVGGVARASAEPGVKNVVNQARPGPKPPIQVAQKAMPSIEDQHNALTEKLARRASGGGKRAARRAQLAAFGKGGEVRLPGANPAKSSPPVPTALRKLSIGKLVERKKQGITHLGSRDFVAKPAEKSLRVMSIADYYDAVVKADGPAPAPTGAPKKFPRAAPSATGKPREAAAGGPMTAHQYANEFASEEPTKTKMKPIGDGEAVANLRVQAHKKEGATRNNYDKSIRIKLAAIKALTAGYNKVSGGGALMAANRGKMTVADLNRAMEAMPKPSGALPPPTTYLPGVHGPEVKQRAAKIRAKASKRTQKSEDMESSMEKPDLKKKQNVVHKSEGAAPMAKTNYNDLFKSELAVANEAALIDCPHCAEPITKSDIATANAKGKMMHGGSGTGQVKPSRPGAGAQKTDAVVGVQNGKGSKARKSDAESDDDMDKSDDDAPIAAQRQVAAPKQMQKGASFRGTEFVQYVDYGDAPGGDAYIAKSIAEAQGALGQQATQPMDLNNDLSRLLV